jgi:hypothetical protein
MTALMYAALARDRDLVVELLNVGADPKVRNRDGNTALELVQLRIRHLGRIRQRVLQTFFPPMREILRSLRVTETALVSAAIVTQL